MGRIPPDDPIDRFYSLYEDLSAYAREYQFKQWILTLMAGGGVPKFCTKCLWKFIIEPASYYYVTKCVICGGHLTTGWPDDNVDDKTIVVTDYEDVTHQRLPPPEVKK